MFPHALADKITRMEKTVVIGISGGIAATKIFDLVKILKNNGLNVIIMMTDSAQKMVKPKEFEKLTGNKVYTNIFQKKINYKKILKERTVDHIELAKIAEVIVIAPATANIIAKIANGVADDFVTTAVLAARKHVIICPSMNTYMWSNPVTQKNINYLQNQGYIILPPDSGLLACGDEGAGRLIEPEDIAKEIFLQLKEADFLKGKKVIVTSGGTSEYIDEVRFISNKSSGKMGAAIAEAAYLKGADVLLIRSTKSVKPRYFMPEIIFETADDLEEILKKSIPNYDICFHLAAVSDFKVKERYSGKLDSDKIITLTFIPRKKILNEIKKYNSKIFLIAWKAVWNVTENDLIFAGQKKLKESEADFIVVNDVGKKDQGFSVDTNEVTILGKYSFIQKIPFAAKKVIGEKIVDFVCKNLLLNSKEKNGK